MIRVELLEGGRGSVRTIAGRLEFYGIKVTMPDGRVKIPLVGGQEEPLEVRADPVDILSLDEVRQIADRLSINHCVGEVGKYEWRVDG